MPASKPNPTRRITSRSRRERSQGLYVSLAVIAAVGIIFGLALVISLPRGASVQPARVGRPMSNFTLTDLSDKPVQLSDFEGQVVVVNTWATWCPPCRAEMPDLNTFYKAHRAEGFVILGVNAGDSAADAAAFAREYDLAFPVLLDPQLELLEQLNVRNYPTSIVIGRDGTVEYIHIGMFTPAQLEAKIGPLLSQ